MAAEWLLVSDLDYTLLGNDVALERFAAWLGPRRRRFLLAYASGRVYDSVDEAIRSTALPQPDAVIAAVGSDVRQYLSGMPFSAWTDRLTIGWDRKLAAETLSRFSFLQSQPAEAQTDFKLSFFAADLPAASLTEIRASLAGAGLRTSLIYSSDRDLDVLPEGVDKGSAASFVAGHWRMPEGRVVVCGDSGNDLAMFQHGFKGVVVGNGHPCLKNLAGTTVYVSQFEFADGVLDGLRHWLGDQVET
jgi:sucrose-6F-phosphate phosphohydrolase